MVGLRRLSGCVFANPMKVLTLGLILGVTLLPILGSLVWSMYDSLSKIGNQELQLQRLIGTVAHLNEVLTMYARLAAATGDPKWEKQYRAVEPKLDDAILGVALRARAEYEKTYAAQTKLAYTKLIEMESVGFALVRKGRHTEASALLFGPQYDQQKALYSEGISKMTKAVRERIAGEVESFRKRIWHSGFLAVTSLMILLAAWIGVYAVVNRHLALRRRSEDALAEEKERLAVTLRSIGDGVITTDISGRVSLINRVAEELTGWQQEDAIGKKLDEVFVMMDETDGSRAHSPVEKILESGTIYGPVNRTLLISKEGAARIISHSGAPIRDRRSVVVGVVLVFRDITDHRHMLREALKAEKLESVGILAGGIAHDFNNILTVVLGNLSMAKMDVAPNSEVLRSLSQAEKAAMRAKGLTQQLLAFSKGGAPIKKSASIRELLIEWSSFALKGSNVKCEFSIQESLWHAEIDEGQIGQVIHNLIINADQAMPDGGTVRVSAENFVVGSGDGLPIDGKRYVKISVTDEGVGVAPEHLTKIFDPYFTTKRQGTGLGLATSYTIIKRHDGHIKVDSQSGLGTTFTMYLPASENHAAQEDGSSDSFQEGKGKVLVMDDEQLIRQLTSEMLTNLGYQVCISKDGSEALSLFERSKKAGEPFDAVIMDLTIPGGMGGKEAITKLLSLDPEIKAVVSSGYCNDPIMANFRSYGFAGVLAKPYTAGEMSKLLYTLIGAKNNEYSHKSS
jgi:PAS domain S-box-containing protein